MTALGFFVSAIGVLLVMVELAIAVQTGWLMPDDVVRLHGGPGISVAYHGGMLWGDLILLTPMCSYLVAYYGEQWGLKGLAIAFAIGVVFTAVNHIALITGQQVPDPLGWKKEWFNGMIFFHAIFMTGAVTIIMAFAFFTPSVNPYVVMAVGVLVGIHLMFGIHIPLGVVNRFVRDVRFPEFIRPDSIAFAAGLWAMTAAVATYEGGWRTTMVVGFIGAICVLFTMGVYSQTEPVAQ